MRQVRLLPLVSRCGGRSAGASSAGSSEHAETAAELAAAETAAEVAVEDAPELLDLDEALTELAESKPRAAKVWRRRCASFRKSKRRDWGMLG